MTRGDVSSDAPSPCGKKSEKLFYKYFFTREMISLQAASLSLLGVENKFSGLILSASQIFMIVQRFGMFFPDSMQFI